MALTVLCVRCSFFSWKRDVAQTLITAMATTMKAEQVRNHSKGFKDFYLKVKALTVLCVPYSKE